MKRKKSRNTTRSTKKDGIGQADMGRPRDRKTGRFLPVETGKSKKNR
jgi:hypothetical protein